MGIAHPDENRAVGMGLEAMFNRYRAQLIVLSIVFSHCLNPFLKRQNVTQSRKGRKENMFVIIEKTLYPSRGY